MNEHAIMKVQMIMAAKIMNEEPLELSKNFLNEEVWSIIQLRERKKDR